MLLGFLIFYYRQLDADMLITWRLCIYLLKRAGRKKKKISVFYAIEYSSIDIITSKISEILFTQQIKRTLVTSGTNALAVIPQAS